MRWTMRCPRCKAPYAYTEEPSQKPEFGKIPDAKYWRYMDGNPVVAGTAMFCEPCGVAFIPLIQDVLEEETPNAHE